MIDNIIKHLNINKISSVLAFANTPYYIFKHLKKESSILNLNRFLETEEIVHVLGLLIEKEEKSKDDYIVLYALLIALTIKPDEIALDFLRQTSQDTKVYWYKELIHIYLSSFKSINSHSFDLGGTIPNQVIFS